MKHYLALDIGGTFIKYGVFDEDYNELTRGKEPTHGESAPFLEQLIQIVKREGANYDIVGVGVSIGGFINPKTGENVDPSVGYHFRAFNLKEEITRQTGYPVSVENDANCALLAEYCKGAAQGCEDVCMVTVGTGIGGAIIVNGKLLRGRHFRAGEFGFMHIQHLNVDGEERFGSANAMMVLVLRVRQALGKEIDGEYIFAHLEDEMIWPIYTNWLNELAMTVGNIAVCFDPERILIGGGVSAEPRFIEDLKQRVQQLHPDLTDFAEIRRCQFENNAGKMGAIYHFREEHE